MISNLIKKDLSRNLLTTAMIFSFVTITALVFSVMIGLSTQLSHSIDRLMESGKTPHFMQMHVGPLDKESLFLFSEQDEVESYQLVEFLNVEGSSIQFSNFDLSDSMQDHGFSIQNQQFDLLFDERGQLALPQAGEIYLPMSYSMDETVAIGDRVIVSDIPFVVSGFLRDSQMSSSLASSKRYLVSEQDFEKLKESGTLEYLIEYRLKDLDDLAPFEKKYTESQLPSNGPTITWGLFKLIHSVSDGILIAVLFLIGTFLFLVSCLSIRFLLLSKIEDDMKEISVMRAIGLRVSDIKRVFLLSYALLIVLAGFTGTLLSFALLPFVQSNIALNTGVVEAESIAILPFLFTIILQGVLILYVYHLLGRIRHITGVPHAIHQNTTGIHLPLRILDTRLVPLSLSLAGIDLIKRFKMYSTLFLVSTLLCFIFAIPANISHTISSPSFISTMGVGVSDAFISFPLSDDRNVMLGAFLKKMRNDPSITSVATRETYGYKAITSDHQEQNIKVELGDHALFPIQYTSGRLPLHENEIAVSSLQAEALTIDVGDSLHLLKNGQPNNLIITGIYSDITNGGKTAKAVFKEEHLEPIWISVLLTISEDDPTAVLDRYRSDFSDLKIIESQQYVKEVFKQILDALHRMTLLSMTLAVAICFVLTYLLFHLLLRKDRAPIAILLALGFRTSDILWQYRIRLMACCLLGVAFGILLASTLGERIAGMFLTGFGILEFRFVSNPLFNLVLSPLVISLASLSAMIMIRFQADQYPIVESIKE